MIGQRFFWRPERGVYGERALRHRLDALSRLGLIVHNSNPYSTPLLHGRREHVIRVTCEGARVAEVDLGPAPLVISELRHTLALVQLCESLQANNPTATLTTERELRAQIYRALRNGERDSAPARIADALLHITTGEGKTKRTVVIAVELDTSRKDAHTMERMIRAYDREPVDRVWWFVTRDRLARIRDFVKELHHEARVQVFPWPT